MIIFTKRRELNEYISPRFHIYNRRRNKFRLSVFYLREPFLNMYPFYYRKRGFNRKFYKNIK